MARGNPWPLQRTCHAEHRQGTAWQRPERRHTGIAKEKIHTNRQAYILYMRSIVVGATHLVQSKIRSMPSGEEDRGMGAVTTEPAARLPVRIAPNAVPWLEGHAMDAGHLVVRGQLGLAQTLQVLDAQDEEVELVGRVRLQVAQFPADGHSSCYITRFSKGVSAQDGSYEEGKLTIWARGGGNPRDCNVAAAHCYKVLTSS
jgi:hypothetical protein